MSAMRVKSYAALDIDAVSRVDEPVARGRHYRATPNNIPREKEFRFNE
jgi:hypothetical protein